MPRALTPALRRRAVRAAAALAVLAAVPGGSHAHAVEEPDVAVELVEVRNVAPDTYDVAWRVSTSSPSGATPNVQLWLHIGTDGASTLHVERDGAAVSCPPFAGMLRCDVGLLPDGASAVVVWRVRHAPGGHARLSAHVNSDADSSNNHADVTIGTPPTGGGGGGGGGGGCDPPRLPACIGGDYAVSVVEVPAAPVIDRPAVVKLRVRFTAPRYWAWLVWLHAAETTSASVSWPACPRGTYQSDDRCRLRLEGTESEVVVDMHVVPRGPTAIVQVALTGDDMVDADPSNDVVTVRLEAVAPKLPLRFNGTRGHDIIEGSRFADVIEGKAGNDNLFGHGGNDVIRGGAGNDYLHGGLGRDVLEGGAGNDLIGARDRVRGDRIRCGPGRDRVIADPGDVVARDCERVTRR